ncbi:hypothetical protein RSOLAG1IB_12007 [Rhizoctonia solani AG-1 IB]|uniref:AAA+ ATPase domain-containing protein n=1 Tax=Thanatephorus cucumeris (strain AG1-IB / isolate 7/3/14) TaxID=1108050 RepID=A0A0B7FKW2_THACB|nr:hypothetical protein RSOLAG1IB_12007 [Rhizoctonia solani AG-1 IB]
MILLLSDKEEEISSFISLLVKLARRTRLLDLEDKFDENDIKPTGAYRAQGAPTHLHAIPFTNDYLNVVTVHYSIGYQGIVPGSDAHTCIIETIKHDIASLDSILILIDGTLEQLSPISEYMLCAIATILPRNMIDSVGILLTNCDLDCQKFDTQKLPVAFSHIKTWTFQDPLPLCISYRAQERTGSHRQRSTQRRKLELMYDASVDTLNDIMEWIDQTPALLTACLVDMHSQLSDVSKHMEQITRAAVKYQKLRESLVDLRRQRNEKKRLVHKITDEAELAENNNMIARMQTGIDGARESLKTQDNDIAQKRANILILVKSLDKKSLGVTFAQYTRSSLKAFRNCKSHQSALQCPLYIDARIDYLEKCARILEPDNSVGSSSVLPGLTAMKSVIGPLKLKKRLTILLVGETGCGKTAFMSLLYNLFQGYGPFELEDENNEGVESGLKKQQSQTNHSTLYSVTCPDGTEIQILDTPGLADTRGVQQDEQHKANINRAIQESVTTIDAVLIMANGTTERIPAATHYTLCTLASLFPHSIVDNIAFVFTHCDSFTQNLNMASLPDVLKKSKYWTLENPLAYHKNYQRELKAAGSENTLSEGRKRLESIYQKTASTLNEWLAWIDVRCPQPTHEINQLYQTMLNIEGQIEAAISLMTRLGERRNAVEITHFALENLRWSKKSIKELCNETIEYWEREPSDQHHTLCIASGCYRNCHIGCSVPFTLDPVMLGQHCIAFESSRSREIVESSDSPISHQCKTCPHQASEHRHYKAKYAKRERDLYPTAKSRLATAETEEQRLQVARRAIQEELDRTQLALDEAQLRVNRLIDGYNNQSLNKDFAGHINSTIQMLELRLKELISKPGTKTEQDIVRSAIQNFRSKLDVIEKSQERKSGEINQVTELDVDTTGRELNQGVKFDIEDIGGGLNQGTKFDIDDAGRGLNH